MTETDYSGVAMLLAGTAVHARQVKQEWADQLPDLAGAHVWTPAMRGKDGLRIGRVYLAQGCGLDLCTEVGRRALSTALRCAQKTPGWDRQVWELTADGRVRPFGMPAWASPTSTDFPLANAKAATVTVSGLLPIPTRE